MGGSALTSVARKPLLLGLGLIVGTIFVVAIVGDRAWRDAPSKVRLRVCGVIMSALTLVVSTQYSVSRAEFRGRHRDRPSTPRDKGDAPSSEHPTDHHTDVDGIKARYLRTHSGGDSFRLSQICKSKPERSTDDHG
jgi:hypothetical protein